MSQYYFLIASLPELRYGDRPPLDGETFLALAAEHLRPAELAALRAASIDAPLSVESDSPADRRWRRAERGLRNALVRSRAARRRTEGEEYVRRDEAGHDETVRAGLDELVRTAVAEESPLSGEELLDRARWRELDELEAGHYFDLERLVVYFLKLQLLNRRARFSREEGERVFDTITRSILDDYYQEQDGT